MAFQRKRAHAGEALSPPIASEIDMSKGEQKSNREAKKPKQKKKGSPKQAAGKMPIIKI